MKISFWRFPVAELMSGVLVTGSELVEMKTTSGLEGSTDARPV